MMKTFEEMKQYILDNNLSHLVRELTHNAESTVKSAVEYVYDAHTMTNFEFAAKYHIYDD